MARHRHRNAARVSLLFSMLIATATVAASGPATTCVRDSGRVGVGCLRDYVDTIATCRFRAAPPCETAARADGGALDVLLADTQATSGATCTDTSAQEVGYLGGDEVGFRVAEACGDFGEDILGLVFADVVPSTLLGCQKKVVRELDRLRRRVEDAFGRCYLREYAGGVCKRARRDGLVARTRALEGKSQGHFLHQQSQATWHCGAPVFGRERRKTATRRTVADDAKHKPTAAAHLRFARAGVGLQHQFAAAAEHRLSLP